MLPPGRLFAFLLTSLIRTRSDPVQQDHLAALLEYRPSPNPHTQHLRILDIVQNISQTPGIRHNPAIIALPYWVENQYLLHQESAFCEANICTLKGDTK
jgi:hypothetical protein